MATCHRLSAPWWESVAIAGQGPGREETRLPLKREASEKKEGWYLLVVAPAFWTVWAVKVFADTSLSLQEAQLQWWIAGSFLRSVKFSNGTSMPVGGPHFLGAPGGRLTHIFPTTVWLLTNQNTENTKNHMIGGCPETAQPKLCFEKVWLTLRNTPGFT